MHLITAKVDSIVEDIAQQQSILEGSSRPTLRWQWISEGAILGLYILHPNNIGNASYTILRDVRDLHIGVALVKDCLEREERGFRILQINAVLVSNTNARHLYEC